MSGNVFKAFNGSVDRVEGVDTSFAPLDNSRMRNIWVEANTFTAVSQLCANPVRIAHTQATAATVWTADASAYLPFGGWARRVDAMVSEGMITGTSNQRLTEMPFTAVQQGAAKNLVTVNWANAAKGTVQLTIRMDSPN